MIISGNVTILRRQAFFLTTGLESIIIGDSEASIEKDAFFSCTLHKTVVLGSSFSFFPNVSNVTVKHNYSADAADLFQSNVKYLTIKRASLSYFDDLQ